MSEVTPEKDPTKPEFWTGTRLTMWLLFGTPVSIITLFATSRVGPPWLVALAFPPLAVVLGYEALRSRRERRREAEARRKDEH